MSTDAANITELSNMLGALAAAQTSAATGCQPAIAVPANQARPVAAETAPRVDAQAGADFLHDRAFSVFLSASVDQNLASRLPVTSFENYYSRLLAELGNPEDPISRMMVEQLVVNHFVFLRLQVRVAHAKSSEECSIVEEAACRTMAEFRKSAMALHELRGSVKATTEVAQDPPNRQAALPQSDGKAKELPPQSSGEIKMQSTELGSKAASETSDHHATADERTTVLFKKPKPRRRRTKKSA